LAAMTIKEVAKLAGVSIATVSRVINGTSYVSPAIVEKVESVIHKSHFVPNIVARSLRYDNTKMIGVVISDISNSYFNIIAKIAEDVMRDNGFSMIVCSTEEDQERELNYLRLLIGRKVDGIILNSTAKNDDFIAEISKNLPVVLINRRVANTGFRGDFIDSSNQVGAALMVEHLYSKGHRKIGLINGDLYLSTGRERFEGFIDTMNRHGILVDDRYPYRYDGHFHMEGGYQGAQYLYELPDPPTAMVIMNNTMGIGALKYFKAKGVKVPDQISTVVYGDIFNSDILYVEPDHVTLSPYVIGKKAADFILERTTAPDIRNREVIYMPSLIAGNSVREIPAVISGERDLS
jgi:DNA-binding LacI/PurR family transcriptional regulator